MEKLLNDAWYEATRKPRQMYWLIRVCWRRVNGRWFIMRDVPIDILAWMSGDETIGDEAAEELLGRLRAMERELAQKARAA